MESFEAISFSLLSATSSDQGEDVAVSLKYEGSLMGDAISVKEAS